MVFIGQLFNVFPEKLESGFEQFNHTHKSLFFSQHYVLRLWELCRERIAYEEVNCRIYFSETHMKSMAVFR